VVGGSVSKLLTLETAVRSQIGVYRGDVEAIKMVVSSRVLLLSPATADRSRIGLNRSELEEWSNSVGAGREQTSHSETRIGCFRTELRRSNHSDYL
jgi:hypothetical protein